MVKIDGGGFVINGADTVLLHKGNVWRGKYACIWTLSKKREVERVGGGSNPNIKNVQFFSLFEIVTFPMWWWWGYIALSIPF